MANVHVDLLDNINVVSVANEFAGLNNSRRKIYEHFSDYIVSNSAESQLPLFALFQILYYINKSYAIL
jgi:hypothetical protein